MEAQVRAVSGLGGVVGCFSPLPEEVWELGEGLVEKQDNEVSFLPFELWISKYSTPKKHDALLQFS